MVCKKDVRCDKKIEMLDGKHSAKQAAFLHFFLVLCLLVVVDPSILHAWILSEAPP